MIKFNSQIKIRVALQLILIIILGLVIYANSMEGDFIWDDYFQVKNNAYIKSWSNFGRVFLENMGSGAGYRTAFYRPLQTITYMLDYSFYGLNPAGFHITNILLHISVGLAIYWLISILFSNPLLSLLTSLLFVAQPVNTEAISFISDRAEPLVALFILLSMIFYIKYLQSRNIKIYGLLIISFILALFSKESSLILPVLLLLYHYVFRVKLEIRAIIFPFIIAMLFLMARGGILKSQLLHNIPAAIFMQRVPGFFAAVAGYLRLLILPFDLHLEYSYIPFHFYEPIVIIGEAITFLLIIYAFIKRKDNALITFSIFWFFITLLPVSNIYPINDSYMAERWLYLPAIGLILIPAGGLSYLCNVRKFRRATFLFIIAALAFYSFLTIRQNKYWAEPISFCKRSLELNPQSWKLHNQLGLEYYDIGNYGKAISAYRKALEIDPGNAGLSLNINNAYDALMKEGDLGYRKVKGKNSQLINRYYENGNEHMAIGRIREAIVSYNEGLKLEPGNLALSNALGNAYIIAGRYGEAIALFKKIIEINPGIPVIYNNLAVAYYYDKQYDLAIIYCDKAIDLGYKVMPKLLESLKPYRR